MDYLSTFLFICVQCSRRTLTIVLNKRATRYIETEHQHFTGSGIKHVKLNGAGAPPNGRIRITSFARMRIKSRAVNLYLICCANFYGAPPTKKNSEKPTSAENISAFSLVVKITSVSCNKRPINMHDIILMLPVSEK